DRIRHRCEWNDIRYGGMLGPISPRPSDLHALPVARRRDVRGSGSSTPCDVRGPRVRIAARAILLEGDRANVADPVAWLDGDRACIPRQANVDRIPEERPDR